MEINSEYGKRVLRISLSLVFLWFGINQLYFPSSWIGFVPSFLSGIFGAGDLVFINGSLEVVFGLMILFGIYLRFSSLILSLHLFGIAFSLGYGAIAVRDFGLALATLSLFFFGKDKWCFS